MLLRSGLICRALISSLSTLALFSVGFVSAFVDSVGADLVRMLGRPDVRTQRMIVCAARQESVQDTFQIAPHVQVVSYRTAHQSHHGGRSFSRRNAADEQPVLTSDRNLLDGLVIRPSLFWLFMGWTPPDPAFLTLVLRGLRDVADR